MAKKKSTKTKKSSVANYSFLDSIRKYPGFYGLILLGLVAVIWPFFFINEFRQYPECIAYDFFPGNIGRPSASNGAFFFLIHLPSILVGVFLISSAISYLKLKAFRWRQVFATAVVTLLVVLVVFVGLKIVTFQISSDTCANYQVNQFPDLKFPSN